jgi:hypothetical protein
MKLPSALRSRKVVLLAYLAAIHGALGIALIGPSVAQHLTVPTIPEEESIIPRLREVHAQMDASVPAGAAVFLGDSITMALATAAVEPRAVNYGIGWQRSDQLLVSMKGYGSLQRAGRVFVMIGTNDLLQGREAGIGERYRAILSTIPAGIPVVMSSPPPIGPITFYGVHKVEDAAVRQAGIEARAACAADPRCRFVDTYSLLKGTEGALLPDQIHLAPPGYTLWIRALKGLS